MPSSIAPDLTSAGPAFQSNSLALVMRGGGVKGLAFAGAVYELERYYRFDTFVGTSAGAIAAALLGAGFNARELQDHLAKMNFLEFLDGRFPWTVWYLLTKWGIHPGDAFRNRIRELLNDRLRRIDRIPLRALPNRTILYAADTGLGSLTFDSCGDNCDVDADFAVRCSMSIPLFFWPQHHNGRRVLDGGLLNNFPLEVYLRQNPGAEFIALYLGSTRVPSIRSRSLFRDIIKVLLDRDEIQVAEIHRDRTIIIDPSPVHTTDFALSAAEKDFLVLQGRAAALAFISARYPDSPAKAELRDVNSQAVVAREQALVQARKRRRLSIVKAMVLAGLLLGFAALGVFQIKAMARIPLPRVGDYACSVEDRLMTSCRIVRQASGHYIYFESPTGDFASRLIFRGELTCNRHACTAELNRVLGRSVASPAGVLAISRSQEEEWRGEWKEENFAGSFSMSYRSLDLLA